MSKTHILILSLRFAVHGDHKWGLASTKWAPSRWETGMVYTSSGVMVRARHSMHIIHSHGFCWFVQQVSHLVGPRKRFVPPNSHAKSAEPGRDRDQSPLASISSEFGEIHSSKSSKPNSKQMILNKSRVVHPLGCSFLWNSHKNSSPRCISMSSGQFQTTFVRKQSGKFWRGKQL